MTKMDYDIVSAVPEGYNYLVPDSASLRWVLTNPEKHAEVATRANQVAGGKLKPLIRMVKYWNRLAEQKDGEKPLSSFHLEATAFTETRSTF